MSTITSRAGDGSGLKHVPAANAEWKLGVRPGLPAYFESRELGLAAVTDGLLKIQHIRGKGGVSQFASEWHAHKLDLQLLYVIAGSMKIEYLDGTELVLRPGDSGQAPPGAYWHRENSFTEDYEVIEVTSPSVFETIVDDGAADKSPSDQRWRLAEGPPEGPPGVEFSPLGNHSLGNRNMSFRVIRFPAVQTTPWPQAAPHMAVVTGGAAELLTASGGLIRLATGDAVFFGADSSKGLLLTNLSEDFVLLELRELD